MPAGVLDAEQIARYWEEGYLVVSDLLTDEEVSAFLAHEKSRPRDVPFGLHGHTLDPQYRYLATHPRVAGGAARILDGSLRIVQTMLLDKPPDGGLGIALHQDSHYLPNEPNTLMACWLALSDTDGGNGGLCVVPRSHRSGLRAARKARDTAEHAVWETRHTMRDRHGKEWEETLFSFEIEDLDPAAVLRLTVPRGAGVFFTGLTIHGSFANRTADRPRVAFAVHFVREGTWVLRTDVQDTMPV
jgi:ectoine hydroxylase-related dioxygenase (phytanoyl-CoA dioxygenase family)